MEIALFDLDHTLLTGDSDHAWSEYLVAAGILQEEAFRQQNDTFMVQYKNQTLDIEAFLDFQLRPLKDNAKADLLKWRSDFMATVIAPMITEPAKALLDRHRNENTLMAIITATNRFITGPIAEKFEVEHLIATEPEEINGQYTGKIVGVPCFQAGKITRLNQWLQTLGQSLDQFERSYFYSDSANDLPLLNAVTDPVAVNPDPTLLKVATEKNWPIVHLS